MQLLKKILEKRRFKADDLLMGELDLMIKFISLISKSDFQEGKTQSIDSILETELEYKKHSDLFIQEFEKSSLPFFWQDIFYVGMALRRIVELFKSFYSKQVIFRSKYGFTLLFNNELTILNNIRSFFEEYLHNKKYVSNLLTTNAYEIDKCTKNCLDVISSSDFNSFEYLKVYKLAEVFERINNENRIINDLLRKIIIGTNI